MRKSHERECPVADHLRKAAFWDAEDGSALTDGKQSLFWARLACSIHVRRILPRSDVMRWSIALIVVPPAAVIAMWMIGL